MEVLRSAVAGIDAAPAMPEDPELTKLRAQVAKLEAEREALQAPGFGEQPPVAWAARLLPLPSAECQRP